MFDLVPFSVFEGRIYQPRLQSQSLSKFQNFESPTPKFSLDCFNNFNSSTLNDFQSESRVSSQEQNYRTVSMPNVKPENMKISLDKKQRVLSISAVEIIEKKRDSCEYSSSSSVSNKIQLPDNVKFETLKSELDSENGSLEVKWELEKATIEDKEVKVVIPVEFI